MPKITFREKATQLAVKEAAAGIREQGTNTGPRVKEYQQTTSLGGTGWPWCAAFVNWAFAEAGRPLAELDRSASVGFLDVNARKHGWLVNTPQRGDVFCYRAADGDTWPDHTGIVLRRNPDGSLRTVEGNTSGTSIAEGDGVYVKDRPKWFADRCTYIRVPGETTVPPKLVRWAIRDTPDTIKWLRAQRAKRNAEKKAAAA